MAFLHTIRLKGFKTFARSTELLIEPGVTVIIGPNGSGKSNIADGVLWALGEQSPTAIRGRSMQDVIFSGSEGRKGAASAEVTLAFDNSSGAFPLEYEEVEVTRSVARDGSSSYRLNGASCRLTDVQELISAVGLGREMHSVISQGKVEEFLSSTPLARRAMVEEAAGLGRYKKRRQRSQAKLEKVQSNLDRVEDIETEVRKALRPLRAQVTAAERHAETTEELAEARSRLLLLELVSLTAERAERGEKRGQVTSAREEAARELEAIRVSRAREEEEFARTIRRREALTAQYHEARGHTERIQSRAATLTQRASRLQGDLERTRRRRQMAEAELEAAGGRLESISAAPGYSASRLEFVQRAAEKLGGQSMETRRELEAAEAAHEEAKDLVFELESNRSRLAQERDLIRRELAERDLRRTELEARSQTAAERAAGIEADVQRLGGEREGAQAALEEGQRSAQEARERVRELETELTAARAGAREAGEQLADLDARSRVAQAVISRREGVPEAAQRIRDTRGDGRLMIELLEVEPGYERAVAAALGSLAYAVVLDGTSELALLGDEGSLELVWPESLDVGNAPPGRRGSQAAGNADAMGLAPRPESAGESLWQHFSLPDPVAEAVRRLLPPLLVADDLTAARSLLETADAGQAPALVVTRQGELAQGGFYGGRRLEAGSDVFLGARAELDAVRRERESALERGEQAGQAVARMEGALESARRLVRETDQAAREASRSAAALEDEVALFVRRLEEARQELDEARERRERDREIVASLEEQLAAAQAAYEEHGTRVAQTRDSLVSARSRAEEAREELSRVEQKRSQAMLLQVKLRERRRAYEEEQARAHDSREQARRTVRALAAREQRLALTLPILERLRDTVAALGEEFDSKVGGLAAGVEESRRRTDGFSEALKDHGRREADLQQRLAELSESLVEVEVALAHLEDRVEERERALEDLRRRHLSPRNLSPADVGAEDADELRSRVERLERKRERIGPINPLAEQEYQETRERADFLAEQRRDLESSVAELARIIGDLDDHIESTFNEVFEQTREHFEEMVAVLFPGGRGLLKLVEIGGERAEDLRAEGEDPDEAGDTAGEAAALEDSAPEYARKGVVLEIKPPRKAPRALSLLSGGEKALAAIAFLFALFLARPAPFYILDEVEAALDDTNIGRFLSLIRRFQDRTQFIVITHQRRTMEVADTLYGVAMDADGTSRVLSRRLTVAVEDEPAERGGSLSL